MPLSALSSPPGSTATWRPGAATTAADIGELFSADRPYSYRAGTEVVIGRDAIVAAWLESPDDAGHLGGQLRAARRRRRGPRRPAAGRATSNADGSLRDEYSNIFVCRFDEAAACTEFTEWWIRTGPPEAA